MVAAMMKSAWQAAARGNTASPLWSQQLCDEAFALGCPLAGKQRLANKKAERLWQRAAKALKNWATARARQKEKRRQIEENEENKNPYSLERC
jgi:hypothetical protein